MDNTFSPAQTGTIQNDRPISVGNWLITLIVLAIPLVNIIMLFVWAFSNDTPVSKRNYCKAALIMFAIGIGLFILLAVVGGGLAALTGAAGQPQPSGGGF